MLIYSHGKDVFIIIKELTLDYYGLPPKQKHYSLDEKALIIAKAEEVGVSPIAEAYGFPWQTIVSWKRYYEPIIIQSPSGQEITPKTLSMLMSRLLTKEISDILNK